MTTHENQWLHKGEPFTSEMIGDYVGFVYLIEDITNNKKYVGKKLFKSKTKLPPLKGKTRKRTVIKESDWKSYSGSNELLKSLVESLGREMFTHEILHLCKSKGELSYMELFEQVKRGVLMSDEYYNGIIQVKIHSSHVKNINQDDLDFNT
jgi:hypothetical protein